MNVGEMRVFARSLVRDNQFLTAHFVRFLNMAYRQVASEYMIPRLYSGDQVVLSAVSGSTNQFYLPYDFQRTISFVDPTGRSLDPIKSEDVRQFGEYNTFGSFVQFYECNSVSIDALYDSFTASVTCTIVNGSKTVTASSAVFTSAHPDEWLLPLNRISGNPNPDDFAYKIASTSGTVAVPVTTCTLERPFKGTLSDAGTVGNFTAGYFQIRPQNTPIIRIWGDPGDDEEISIEYQRVPTKLSNEYDAPEDVRLSMVLVYKAIELAGVAYQNGFMVKKSMNDVAQTLSQYQTSKDFDKHLIHNFLTTNPNVRGYSQNVVGRHIGQGSYSTNGIRY